LYIIRDLKPTATRIVYNKGFKTNSNYKDSL